MSNIDFDKSKQLKHWENREKDLESWLKSHDSDHPNWQTNLNDYKHAGIKIQQLTQKGIKHANTLDTYSLPNFKH